MKINSVDAAVLALEIMAMAMALALALGKVSMEMVKGDLLLLPHQVLQVVLLLYGPFYSNLLLWLLLLLHRQRQ